MPNLNKTFRFNDFFSKHTKPYYPGEIVVNFEKNDNTEDGLHVEIEASQLTLHSIQRGQDQEFYSKLRDNPEANRLFGAGNTLSINKANEISNMQIARWENGCALAGFIIMLKEEEGNHLKTNQIRPDVTDAGRIGYVVLGYGGQIYTQYSTKRYYASS